MDNSNLNVTDDLTMSGKDQEPSGWKKREMWRGRIDFFLACVGFSVGIGNVWRFPYLCYKNGGGAFLIPYVISVILGGFPVFYLEMAVGQYMTKGGPQAWNMVPLFQGIGLASLVIIIVQGCYYNVILAWAYYYLFSSFKSELPWDTCSNDWNTPNCTDDSTRSSNITAGSVNNRTEPVTEFWENKVLKISSGLDEPGIIKWDLALCLLLAWAVVYICICKGIKSSGKVMYFTATSPYVFMLILLVRNCTLDGATDGIVFYLQPNLTKLSEPEVWVDAGTQIFFSWAIGLGSITVLGSYNKFNHNSLRDAVGISIVNALTSFFAGFIVFTILGFMAKEQGVLVSDVAESGPGLAFIAYPKAMAQLPLSPFWSILFFIMLILIGLDSQFINVETVITAIVDQFPHLLRKGYRKEIFIGIVCILMFVIGLSMVTEGGMYVLQILDYYTGNRVLILVAMSEVIAISYFYGVRRFTDNVRMMIGNTSVRCILPYLQISWIFFTPVFCAVIFALCIYNYSELTYQRPYHPKYFYPHWAVALGWTLAVVAMMWVPLIAIYRVLRLVWIGGRLTQGDWKILLSPYYLSEHQRRPQDKNERCLADLEGQERTRLSYFNGRQLPEDNIPEAEDSKLML